MAIANAAGQFRYAVEQFRAMDDATLRKTERGFGLRYHEAADITARRIVGGEWAMARSELAARGIKPTRIRA